MSMPASKKPSVKKENVSWDHPHRKKQGKKLTTTHLIITAPRDAFLLRSLASTGVSDSLATGLGAPALFLRFASAACAFVDAGAAALRHAEEFPDLKEVRFNGVDEALRLTVFAGSADADTAVFDDVADAEAFA